MLRLIAVCGDATRRLPLPSLPATLGASAENDLVLPFRGVSRRHAHLEAVDGGVVLIDRGSKNGLISGGRRRRRLRLGVGDVVRLGEVLVRLEEVEEDEAELALRFPTPVSSTHGTGETAPRPVLDLVGRLEALREVPENRVREEILDELAGAVGASAAWLWGGPEGRKLLAAARDRPGPEERRQLLDALARAGVGVTSIAGEGWHALAATGALSLVARFPGRASEDRTWVEELLLYVLERLGGGVEARTRAGGPLRLPPGMIVGSAAASADLLAQLGAAARSDLPVLLTGETGTGKELAARALHLSTAGADAPLVAINCAAIPDSLLEAELFGVEGRVATGVDPRPGRFAQAAGGTLLLDEVGELPPRLQAKLLRVLQEREVLPLGGVRPRPLAARLVAATNRELLEAGDPSFRRDLYYRLAAIEIELPPLRERLADLPLLVTAFARRAARRQGKRLTGISRKALSLLRTRPWPGNVRELEHAVERAVLRAADGGALESADFSPFPAASPPVQVARPTGAADDGFRPLAERIAAVEVQAIREALDRAGGNRSRAAELLGISRNGLAGKMRRLGLEPPALRLGTSRDRRAEPAQPEGTPPRADES